MKIFPKSAYGNILFILPLAAFLLLSFIVLPATATPPNTVSLTYGQETSDLDVTITHPVMSMQGHYIKEVKLTVNGNVVRDSQYTSQTADTFTYTYPLALTPGDLVEATVICALSGSGTGTFIMPGPTATMQAGLPAATTARATVLAITALAGIGFALMVRRWD
jgi:hypothetical protein